MTRDRLGQLCCLAILVAAAAVPPDWIGGLPTLCPFRLLTGLPCPGCGMTRSLVALTHGDVLGALFFHPLGPIVALALVALLLRTTRSPLNRYLNRLLTGSLARVGVAAVLSVWAVRLPLFLSGRWVF